jgi:hypothetical protein
MARERQSVRATAPTEIQSPFLGKRFPIKIWTTKAIRGRRRIAIP